VTEQQFRQWLDAYEAAFEGRDPDAAAKLFTDDATYRWGPFGELLRGPEEIRAKWAASVDPGDTNVRCDLEILLATPELGVARWIASHERQDEGKIVRYDGVFLVSLTDEGLCDSFREWWNTREDPL
jgi:ketosteroid isomerase-like protein